MKTASELLLVVLKVYSNYRGLRISHEGSENYASDTITITQGYKKQAPFFTSMGPTREPQLKKLAALEEELRHKERKLIKLILSIDPDDSVNLERLDEHLLDLRMEYNGIIVKAKHLLDKLIQEINLEKHFNTPKLLALITIARKNLELKTEINQEITKFVLQSNNILDEATGTELEQSDLAKQAYTNSAYYPQIDRIIEPAFETNKVDTIQSDLIQLEIIKYFYRADFEISDKQKVLKHNVVHFYKQTYELLYKEKVEPEPELETDRCDPLTLSYLKL